MGNNNTTSIIIEYYNLPMKVAFANELLAKQAEALLQPVSDVDMHQLMQANYTFRQLVLLNHGGGIPESVCNQIMQLMKVQDSENPYPLTKMYPYLQEPEWQLDMLDVSNMKVNVRYGDEWEIAVRKMEKIRASAAGKAQLQFYPYEPVNGTCYICFLPESEDEICRIVKQILLSGAVDLAQIG